MSEQILPCRYEKDPDIVSRWVGDEYVLVPVRSDVGDLSCIYTLNEVGGRIWELLDGRKSLWDILEVIVDEFEVARSVAESDLTEFITHLESVQAIRRIE